MTPDSSGDILITTSDAVPGRNIVRTLGVVRGSSVKARHVGRDVQAWVRTIFGGEVGVYRELLEKARDEAISRMTGDAKKVGANAVVAFRMATSQVISGAAEVLVYGTAVVVE